MKLASADFDRAFAAVVQQRDAATEQPQRQTAALKIEQADKCPYCSGKMYEATARGHAVYVCDHDRHVVPQEDRGT